MAEFEAAIGDEQKLDEFFDRWGHDYRWCQFQKGEWHVIDGTREPGNWKDVKDFQADFKAAEERWKKTPRQFGTSSRPKGKQPAEQRK
eukprot:tig00020531_g10038.t1